MSKSELDKNNDIAHLTHVIRTPLSTMLGYAELLLMDDKWDDEAREHVEKIIENIQRLDKKLSILNQPTEE